MANIKVYAPSNTLSGQEIADVLTAAGHAVDFDTAGGIGSPTGFNLLIVQQLNITISQVTAFLDAGLGVMVVEHGGGSGLGTGLTTSHVMLNLGLATTYSRNRFFSDINTLETHDATAGLPDPLSYLQSGTTAQGVLDLPLANPAGEVLALGDSGDVDLAAGAAIAAFDVGTIYQKSGVPTPLNSRVAYLGAAAPTAGSGSPTGYSADGETLLEQLVTWLLAGVSAPNQPVITLSDTTPSSVIGSLSAYSHGASVPVGRRFVWLERADGTFIVDPFAISPTELDFVIDGATEDGFIGAQDEDEDGLLSVKAARAAYTLEVGTEGEEEGEGGTVESEAYGTLGMWAWPTAKLDFGFGFDTPDGMTPYYYKAQLVSGATVLGEANISLGTSPVVASFGWLKPGATYTVRYGKKGRIGSTYPFVYAEQSVTIPRVFQAPRIDIRRGALVTGAAFDLEWYESSDCLLTDGDDRLEITYDGVTHTVLDTVDFSAVQVAGRVTHTLDSTALADGRARFAIVRETAGGDTARRYSPVVFIDNASLCTRVEDVSLLLSAFTIIGGVSEATYWDEYDFGGVATLRRVGPANTGGKLVLDTDTPRSFGVVVEGMFAHGGDEDTGIFNGLQYVNDRELGWGVAAYATGAKKTADVRFHGFAAALGTAYAIYEGAPAFNWALGNLYGRGYGSFKIASHNGSEVAYTDHLSETCRQYNRVKASALRWWQDDPWYGVEGFFQQGSVDPQGISVKGSLHGPENESDFSLLETSLVSFDFPCGDPAVSVVSGSTETTFLLRSITVFPIGYGECVAEPPPTTSVGLPLEKAWAFPLDGHVFYVLNLTEDGKTYVFDATTGQWAYWFTNTQPFWNMFRGIAWRGKVVAADFVNAKVWEMDATAMLDEEVYQIIRTVSAFIPVRGKQSFRQGSMRLTASVGAPTQDPATIRMRFSDDGGNSWSAYFDRTLIDGDYSQILKYRSLGRMKAPGRLWEITDTGGVVRIDGADGEIEEPNS